MLFVVCGLPARTDGDRASSSNARKSCRKLPGGCGGIAARAAGWRTGPEGWVHQKVGAQDELQPSNRAQPKSTPATQPTDKGFCVRRPHAKACRKGKAGGAGRDERQPSNRAPPKSPPAKQPTDEGFCVRRPHAKACRKGKAGGAGITSFDELGAADGFREWTPPVRSKPTVCVLSVAANMMKQGTWAPIAAEINLNWCLLQGYRFTLVTRRLTRAGSVRVHWDKPRAALLMAQRGEEECAWIFHLDADAVVHGIHSTLAALINQHVLSQHGLIFTSHTPTTLHAERAGCPCSQALDCRGPALRSELHEQPCYINSGVFLVRNGISSSGGVDMLRRWALADFADVLKNGTHPDVASRVRRRCQLLSPERSSEQTCANTLKLLWPHRVRIVPSSVMNYMNAQKPHGGPPCLQRADTFVCHMMGDTNENRLAALAAENRNQRELLTRLLSARNVSYVTL